MLRITSFDDTTVLGILGGGNRKTVNDDLDTLFRGLPVQISATWQLDLTGSKARDSLAATQAGALCRTGTIADVWDVRE